MLSLTRPRLPASPENNYFGCGGNSLGCDFDLLHVDRDETQIQQTRVGPDYWQWVEGEI